MQKFDLVRWGFTESRGSNVYRLQAYPELHVLEATFIQGQSIKAILPAVGSTLLVTRRTRLGLRMLAARFHWLLRGFEMAMT